MAMETYTVASLLKLPDRKCFVIVKHITVITYCTVNTSNQTSGYNKILQLLHLISRAGIAQSVQVTRLQAG